VPVRASACRPDVGSFWPEEDTCYLARVLVSRKHSIAKAAREALAGIP
jgi:hypothetical protein